jgi:hypothetical protein
VRGGARSDGLPGHGSLPRPPAPRTWLGRRRSSGAGARPLQGLVALTLLEAHHTRPGGPCAVGAEGARRAVALGEARLPLGAGRSIRVRSPGAALLAIGAGHHPPVPVHDELALVEARAGAGLPTGIVRDRADDCDTVVALARQQHFGGGVAHVHQVLTRQVVMGSQRGVHDRQHVVVRGGRRRGLHVGDQVRRVRITRLGDVDLVPHPLGAMLGAVARLGIIGRSHQLGRGGHVPHLPPAQLAWLARVLLRPDPPQHLHRRHFLQPGQLGGLLDRR